MSQNDPKEEYDYFSRVIGCIEDIILSEEFSKLNNSFMEEYWCHFDDTEENKFIYTDIFQNYCDTIEKYIENELRNAIPDFNMTDFEEELRKRSDELDGEVFELLATFTDFVSFKTQFLDYKAMKEGKTVDFSKDFSVKKL